MEFAGVATTILETAIKELKKYPKKTAEGAVFLFFTYMSFLLTLHFFMKVITKKKVHV